MPQTDVEEVGEKQATLALNMNQKMKNLSDFKIC
jgi:hypothetical protein